MNIDTVHIQITAAPPANAGNPVGICTGANTTLNASGGVTYSWSPSSGLSSTIISNPIAAPITSTQYTVTVTDAIGCTGTDTVTVSVYPLPSANAGVDQSVCLNLTVTLNGSGGLNYSWSPAATLSSSSIPNPIATPLATTTYTLLVSDANNCQNTDSMIVTVNALPNIVAGNGGSVCSGSTFGLSAAGGVSYSWSPVASLTNPNISNPIATVNATTTYTVTGTDANTCVNTDTVQLTANPLPLANAGVDVDICSGTSTTLNGSGGISYLWNPAASLSANNISNPVATPLSTTTYTVTVSDALGCTGVDSVVVNVHLLPNVNAGLDDTLCLGNSIQLQGSGAQIYSWSPASSLNGASLQNPIASPIITTTYTLVGDDGFGCTATDSLMITVINPFLMTVSNDTTICAGQTANLSATGANSYQWSPAGSLSSATSSNPNATPVVNTTYTVIGSDNICFFDTSSIQVFVNPLPTLSAGNDSLIYQGQTITLNASGGNGIYSWSPSSGLSCSSCATPTAAPTTTTTYYVTLTDANGCVSYDTITIEVFCNNSSLFIPNAFTPNGDGKNDKFYVRAYGLNQFNYFRVFDRWGQIVFETNDINVGWDGTYNGKALNTDVFVYTVEVVCTDGRTIRKRGNVTLIR